MSSSPAPCAATDSRGSNLADPASRPFSAEASRSGLACASSAAEPATIADAALVPLMLE